MDHFAGLDVSVKETSICIVDDTGKIVREVKVASEPEALLAVLKNPAERSRPWWVRSSRPPCGSANRRPRTEPHWGVAAPTLERMPRMLRSM